VTAILWVASVAAHLGFDYLVGGHGSRSTSFANATILLYLAVTFAVQRMVVMARSQRMAISAQNEVTGLT
jgi:hypothetical protein